MSSCLMAGAMMIALGASGQFTLEWTHSVEREDWRETWEVTAANRLHLVEAAVKGSGAGMEPGPGGHFADGWWVWTPTLGPVPALVLAASGDTPSAWHLCSEAGCTDLGATAQTPIHLSPCPGS
ncbi:DUF1850 domain-containing protein [Pseudooceanicola sp. CBS1P-1]|uniref:DUF1850 domain-containing protein n=1 Tax=Pseudooceanicola albus TaxID=2692189 RepID=A0A6L7G7K6_9RHOB|nr:MULTISPECIES: DUF1850 domain-containing protein [Pseudooceanicola]MBT9384353.1 DUF1850 domain-containing protein [Pseudooceanicola endophyticus]MXN19909.1 DUF1850 domain-containing protein [Pseudooceanicola albus]